MNAFYPYILTFARVMPVVMLFPGFGGQALPARLKLVLALVLTWVIHSLCWMDFPENPDWSLIWLAVMMIAEILKGVFLGIVMMLGFSVVQAAGELIDTVRGQTLIQVMVPQLSDRASSMSQLLIQVSICVFLVSGAHWVVIGAIAESYQVFPVSFQFQPILKGLAGSSEMHLGLIAMVVKKALLLSAPVVIVTFLLDIVLGIINRIVPAIQVFQLGLSMKMWLGILLVLLSASVMVHQILKIIGYFSLILIH